MRFFPYLLRWTPPVTALALCVFACSDGTVETTDDDADAADRPALDGGHDASRSEEDAGVVDASPDAANEVDAAPARPCTDEGWCHIPVPGRQTLNAVWGDGQGTAWAASLEGQILRWDGAAWTRSYYLPVSSGAPALHSIWGSGPDDVWFVGQRPFAAHTNGVKGPDGLPKWTEFDTQSLAPLSAVWGSGPGDVWAVGDYGTIRHFTAGASRWAVVESPTMENLRGLWGAAANDIWAVGENGTILHYDGTAWRTSTGAFPPGKKPHLFSVWGSGPSDVWAVASGVVLHFSGSKSGARGANR